MTSMMRAPRSGFSCRCCSEWFGSRTADNREVEREIIDELAPVDWMKWLAH